MNGATSTTHELLTCPACKKPIHARFSLSVEMDMSGALDDDGAVGASARITGMHVEHDCIPQTKRDVALDRGR